MNAKNIARKVLSAGSGMCASYVVQRVLSDQFDLEEETAYSKARLATGSIVIGMLVSDKVSKHIENIFDETDEAIQEALNATKE